MAEPESPLKDDAESPLPPGRGASVPPEDNAGSASEEAPKAEGSSENRAPAESAEKGAGIDATRSEAASDEDPTKAAAAAEAGAAPDPRVSLKKAPASEASEDEISESGDGDVAAEDVAVESYGPTWLPFVLALSVPVLFFFVLPPLTKSGLWDPYELNVADLARRVALNLHGASDLALEGADNSLPYLNDLGRPQLPFTSIALGFKLFGLHEWAGRAPLALWGLIGVLTTYGFVARLVDKRAAVFSALALTTMPLYFVQARTMLGDIVMMASLAMSFGGAAVAVFGSRAEDRNDLRTRGAWFVVAALGLVTGYFTRGVWLGVGVPAVAIGASYLVALGHGQRFDKLAHVAGALVTVVGGVCVFRGLAALGGEHLDDSTVQVAGSLLKSPSKYPTFDYMVGHVAPALAPWSAFAPFAFGRLFRSPFGADASAFPRESQTRLALLVGAAVAFVAHGWMASSTDLVAFSAPAIVAAACGIALRDYERGAHPSVAVGVGTLVLLALFHHELRKLPEKAFHAFAVAAGATFPESFKNHSVMLWTVALFGFALIAFLTWVERNPAREPFEPKGYLRVLLALRDAWDGMLSLAYFAMVAGASLAGLAVWIGTRQHAKWLPQLSSQMREVVLNAWWITAFAPLAVVFVVYFWCDVWVWAFDRASRARSSFVESVSRGFEPFENLAQRLKDGRLKDTVPKLILGKLEVTEENLDDGVGAVALFVLTPLMYLQVPLITFLVLWNKASMRPLVACALAIPSGVLLFLVLGLIGNLVRGSRAAFLALFGVVVGGILCTSYYPALANQLSPKEVFESYRRAHKGAEPIALLGVGGRTAAYYAGGQPLILKDTNSAYEWLMGGEADSRRFLAVRAEELSRLNRVYRERSGSGQNLPVIDGRSSQIVLVASALADGEKNQNPISRIVLSEMPKPQKPLDVVLENKLHVLGYDIADATGKPVPYVAPGKKYHMRTYFKVLAPIQSEWNMFIHIDGFRRRHNGDHKVCEGKYPMSLWLKDDIIVDDHEFSLEPNFSPGPYNLWFGLFVGETRLKVTSGPSDGDDRVNGGTLRVQ